MLNGMIFVSSWSILDDDFVRLDYEDGDVVYVTRTDFNRAFGAILNADKNDVIRDFAVDLVVHSLCSED